MRQRYVRVFCAVALVASAFTLPAAATAADGCASASAGGEWFTRGGDLSGRRFQPAEDKIDAAAAATLEPAFVFPVDSGSIAATPIVANGCVYFGTSGGLVHKLNADTGALVWTADIDSNTSSLTYDDGRLFANINTDTGVGMVAIEDTDGAIAWRTHIDDQYGVTVNGSPVAWDGMVLTGIAAGIQELESGDVRTVMRGAFALLDQDTGEIIVKTHPIPDDDFAAGYAGGGLWSTPAVDDDAGYAYFGTGNPYSAAEHVMTNSIIKIDVDPSRPTFGQVVDVYKGNTDLYLEGADYKPACEATADLMPFCEPFDIDFGGSPNLWRNDDGQLMVGDLQKSGVYHAAAADTMEGQWTAAISYPAMFGNAGTAAVDDDGVYVTVQPGAMFGLGADSGDLSWAFPTGGTGWATVVSVANGVAYQADNGLLRAIDTSTGLPATIRSLTVDTGTLASSAIDGGVAIANHTVYVNAADALVAYRPAS